MNVTKPDVLGRLRWWWPQVSYRMDRTWFKPINILIDHVGFISELMILEDTY